MMGHIIGFKAIIIMTIILNYPFYPFLSGALVSSTLTKKCFNVVCSQIHEAIFLLLE